MMFQKMRRRKSTLLKQNKVVVQDLSADLVPITGSSRFAVVLHNLLSPQECAGLIRRSEAEGFDDALVQGPGGEQVLRQDVRACGRCIVDDAELAEVVYARIQDALRGTELEKKIATAPWIKRNDAGAGTVSAVGLNERMRFLKYGPGHFFASHRDLRFVRGPDAGEREGETSYVTVQLYLNEKFKGGETRFLCGKRHYDVRPRVGSALIFDHDILHQGSMVTSGIKYSVRTDVMFTPPQNVGQ